MLITSPAEAAILLPRRLAMGDLMMLIESLFAKLLTAAAYRYRQVSADSSCCRLVLRVSLPSRFGVSQSALVLNNYLSTARHPQTKL